MDAVEGSQAAAGSVEGCCEVGRRAQLSDAGMLLCSCSSVRGQAVTA